MINGEGRKPSQVTNSTDVKQLIKGRFLLQVCKPVSAQIILGVIDNDGFIFP